MDPATKIGLAIAFLGLCLDFFAVLFPDELRAVSRVTRLVLGGIGSCLLLIGLLVVCFWPTPERFAVGPKLVVLNLVIVPPVGDNAFAINIYLRNGGDRPAIGMTHASWLGFARHVLTKAEEDKIMAKAIAEAPDPDPNSTDEIEVGSANGFFSAFDRGMGVSQFEQFVAPTNKRPHYLFVAIKYRDPDTHGVVVTEVCNYSFGPVTFQCVGHNQTRRL